MCRASNERGGPRRCPGDARKAAHSAAGTATAALADRDAVADQLAAAVPTNPSVEDVVALHPDQEEMIREMHKRGVKVGLTAQFRDSDGRPMVVFGSNETSTTLTPTSAPAPSVATAETGPGGVPLEPGVSSYKDPMGRVQYKAEGVNGNVLITNRRDGDPYEVWWSDSIRTLATTRSFKAAQQTAARYARRGRATPNTPG
ncbi:hypothetical protein ACWIGI_34675 [Nocardia sp. NPDC055321]